MKDDNGYTLLMAAASYNHVHILDWIWNTHNNNTNGTHAFAAAAVVVVAQQQQDHDGDTLLHYAGSAKTAGWILEKLPLLLEATNQQGKTALQAKREELDELLRDEDVDDDDEDVETLRELVEFLSSRQQ